MVLKNILKYLTIFQNSLTSLIHNKNLMKIFFLPNKSSNNDSLFLVYLNVAFLTLEIRVFLSEVLSTFTLSMSLL